MAPPEYAAATRAAAVAPSTDRDARPRRPCTSSSTRTAASAARRACRPARECDTHKGHSMIHLEYVDRARLAADGAGRLHALRLSRPAPRSARPTRSSGPRTAWCRRRASRAASPATTACWPARSACRRCTTEIELMMKCDMCYDRTSRRQEADVRHGLPEPGALLRHARGDRGAAARVAPGQHVPVRRAGRSRRASR